MTVINTLQDALATFIRSADIEELRDELIDAADEASMAAEPVRLWYTGVWDRLCEFDNGRIDEQRLLADVEALNALAPRSDVVLTFGAGGYVSIHSDVQWHLETDVFSPTSCPLPILGYHQDLLEYTAPSARADYAYA